MLTCLRQRLPSLAAWYCARSYGSSAPLVRSSAFAELTESDVDFFRSVVGPSAVITDAHELGAYNRDWMGKYEGSSKVCIKPKTTAQVSRLLAHCDAKRLAVVPQGGNTGLVGGSVPVFDEVLISTAAMNKVEGLDKVSGVLTCQAGCVLQTLDDYASEHGYTVPLDLGAKGSCHIGGNVSTNAGGLRLLRYGSLHGSVTGLEVVLASGQVMDLMTALRKDNTGYDLKQLFIGAEGTLGVVTAVALQCAPRPSSVQVAYLAVASFEAAQRVFQVAKRRLGEILSAFEFFDLPSLRLTLKHIPGATDPLPAVTAAAEEAAAAAGAGTAGGGAGRSPSSSSPSQLPFFLVVETSGASGEHDATKLEAFVEDVMGQGLVLDGTVAQGGPQADAVWLLRESISEALRHAGAVYKYDVSMAQRDMYRCVEDARERLCGLGHTPESGVLVVGYGHMGDGNLHLNVSTPHYTAELTAAIEPWVYEWTQQHNGSISAEHGLGLMKAGAIGYTKPDAAVDVMRGIKRLLDPNGILNPYKVLPQAPGAAS